jgi:hypothetical protein
VRAADARPRGLLPPFLLRLAATLDPAASSSPPRRPHPRRLLPRRGEAGPAVAGSSVLAGCLLHPRRRGEIQGAREATATEYHKDRLYSLH